MLSVPECGLQDKELCAHESGPQPDSASARSVRGTEAESEQGGRSGNTHLANRQTKQDLETGGEDTLVLGLGVDWGARYFDIMTRLYEAKEKAQQSHAVEVVWLGGRSFLIYPLGSKSGGGKGTYYAYVLESGIGSIKIAKQQEPNRGTPNVFVEVGSLQLMTGGGASGVFDEVKKIVSDLGGTITFDKVSRVDLCADLPGVDVGRFYNLIAEEQYACRARKQDFHKDGTRKTGVTLGAGGDIVCRIYDKAFEVTEAHPDPAKRKFLEAHRWGGPQEEAVRVEFQLRREALRSLGVDTLADYLRLRPAICEYLTSNWLRILEEVPDRENNNTQRTAAHAMWIQVVQAFKAFAGRAQTVLRRMGRMAYDDPVRLVKQATGCLMAAVAQAKDGAMLSVNDFIQSACTCMEFIVTEYGDRGFYERYLSKAARVSVLSAV